MRKAIALPLVVAALVATSAGVANADTVTISPGGQIIAVFNTVGFEGIVVPLFTCAVTLTGTLARGPITLAGRVGSITAVTTRECSGGHTATANELPWTLTGRVALTCPSASTGLLSTVPASFTLDGFLTGTGSMGLLLSSGASPATILFSRLTNGVVVLPAGGNYTQVQIVRCAI